ncbi:hypothetical protein HanIR_Chr11g0510051 [Helianthus annuus]|nr:hypothetical protein HanIR_Chr11g0510051 [Helianthus annuus]
METGNPLRDFSSSVSSNSSFSRDMGEKTLSSSLNLELKICEKLSGVGCKYLQLFPCLQNPLMK